VCVNQTNLNGKLRKSVGGSKQGANQKSGGNSPTSPPPLAIATEFHNEMYQKQTDVTMKRIKNQLMSQ